MLTGPNGQRILINPDDVTSLREPRGEGHFDEDVHCLIFTNDGKFIAVVETCEKARQLLAEKQ